MTHRLTIKATITEVHRCIQALPLTKITDYSVKSYREDGQRIAELNVACDDHEAVLVLEILLRAEAFDPETSDWSIE